MLHPNNLYAFWERNMQKKTLSRWKYYIYNIYLGNIKDQKCRNHAEFWFEAMGRIELWAWKSKDHLSFFSYY